MTDQECWHEPATAEEEAIWDARIAEETAKIRAVRNLRGGKDKDAPPRSLIGAVLEMHYCRSGRGGHWET